MTSTTADRPQHSDHFLRPSGVERVFNRAFNWLVAVGGGLAHNRVLEVRGRKTGKLYRTPVNLMELDGKLYLVAPRGRTAWVQNADLAGEVTLQRGRTRQRFALRNLTLRERPAVLQQYLQRYATTVAAYFTVAPDAPVQAFESIASLHPVYELTEIA